MGCVSSLSSAARNAVHPAKLPVVTPHRPDCVTCRDVRLFYVDDDEDNLVLFKRVLARQMVRPPPVVTCANPMEAAQIYEAHPFRFPVIVLDYAMPRMNGDELGRAIAALAEAFGAKPYICLLSAYVGDRSVSFPVYEKPNGLAGLFETIRSAYGEE